MLLIMGDSGSVSNQELKEVAEKGGEDWIITFHSYSPLN